MPRPTAVLPATKDAANAVNFESLEHRRLMAVISVTDFGATPNNGGEDGPAIQRAINASAPGDTVSFPAGTYNVGGTLTFRADRTFRGEAGATLKFAIANRQYGATFYKDSSNITVEGLKFDGGGLSLSHGSKYTNIKLLNNEITNTAGTAGVYASIPSAGLVVEGNKIHSFSGWGAILWHMNYGSFSRNKLCGITQGAHILAPRDNNQVSFNVGRHLIRMGIEMQAHGNSIARNTTVQGNVFYDWRLPYRDSFGLSIVPDNSINTRVINNYLSANHTGDWNPESYIDSQGQRYGYGIEAGFTTGEVSGNIIGGPFANHVVASHPNTLVRNNKFFGVPKWRDYIAAEPGPGGVGSFIDEGNTIDTNFANMPPHGAEDPCIGVPGGGGQGGFPIPPPLPGGGRIAAPTNLSARAATANRVDLSWKDNSNNEVGFKIERSFEGADGPFVQISVVTVGIQRWSNVGVPADKTIWYRVRAYGSLGNSEYSNVVQVRTPPFGGGPGAVGGAGGGGFAFGGAGTGSFGGLGNGSSFGTGSTGGTFGGVSTGGGTRTPFSDLLI